MLQKLFLYMIMYTDNLYCLLKNNHLPHAIIPSTVVFKTRKYGIIDRLYKSSFKKNYMYTVNTFPWVLTC